MRIINIIQPQNLRNITETWIKFKVLSPYNSQSIIANKQKHAYRLVKNRIHDIFGKEFCRKTILLQLYCCTGPHWFRSLHHIHKFHTLLHVTYSANSSLQTYNQLLTGSSDEHKCRQHNPKFAVFLNQENSSDAYSSNAWLHALPYT